MRRLRQTNKTDQEPRTRTMNQPGGTHMCPHTPPCPDAHAPDREAAHTIASHPEQGWSLLCNGVVIFEDTGELLPDGATIAPHRWAGRTGRAALRGFNGLTALSGASMAPLIRASRPAA